MCLCPDLLRSYRYPGSVCVQTASANIATLAVSAYRPPILTTLPWQRLCPDLLRPVCVNDTIATAYIADCSVVIAAPIRFKVERLEEIARWMCLCPDLLCSYRYPGSVCVQTASANIATLAAPAYRPPVVIKLPWKCLCPDLLCPVCVNDTVAVK